MTIEQKAEEYVESKGKEHFRKFYDEELSMADLLKTCCIEFATEYTELVTSKYKNIIKKIIEDWKQRDCVSIHIGKTIANAEVFLREIEEWQLKKK